MLRKPLRKVWILILAAVFLLTACNQAAPSETDVVEIDTPTPQVTVFTTQILATPLPATLAPPPTATPIPIPTKFDPNDPINAQIYYPKTGCPASRLHIGDRAFVALEGEKVRIFMTSDVLYDPGFRALKLDEVLVIKEGPICPDDWLLWIVEAEDDEIVGWVPEGNGEVYWLLPVLE